MMKYNKTHSIYFSPTGNTKKYVTLLANTFDDVSNKIDLTKPEVRKEKFSFSDRDLVIIGAPVYSGRIPEANGDIFVNLKGNNTPAVLIVTYGNREYEDALLELKTKVEENGFIVFAAAAVIGKHSIMPAVAAERPDANDFKAVSLFGVRVFEKLEKINETARDLKVNGNLPYREIVKIPFVPKGDRHCIECGVCSSICPVEAISAEKPRKTDKNKCIRCFACVNSCPQKARAIRSLLFRYKIMKFEKMLSVRRKEPEFFL